MSGPQLVICPGGPPTVYHPAHEPVFKEDDRLERLLQTIATMVQNGSLCQCENGRVHHFVKEKTCLSDWGELVEVLHQENNGDAAERLVRTASERLGVAADLLCHENQLLFPRPRFGLREDWELCLGRAMGV